MALRQATEALTTLELSDGDFVKVKQDISKKTFRRIVAELPAGKQPGDLSVDDGMGFQAALFEGLVVEWSAKDKRGKPMAPSRENYESLLRQDCEELDVKLAEHFQSISKLGKDEAGKA